jgi:alcohol dehydrogenase
VGIVDCVTPNPTLYALDALAASHRSAHYDGIIALGGGSALDTGKVLAVLLGASAEFSLERHFRSAQSFPKHPPLPVIAIPTTSGTGSEVTPFATVWDERTHTKYSLSAESMFPTVALLDPELTHDLPWEITFPTGLDALCQAMESLWNRNSNPITVSYALRGAALAWEALQRGRDLMQSPPVRSELMEASLLAGLAISHTRTALCHSISYPLTSRFGLEHGSACAVTMPAVLSFNIPSDNGNLTLLARRLVDNEPTALVTALVQLLAKLGIQARVRDTVGSFERALAHVDEMFTPNRVGNNLRTAGKQDIIEILQRTREFLSL